MLNGVQGTNNYQVAFQGIGAKTIQQFIPEIGDEAAAHLSKYFDAELPADEFKYIADTVPEKFMHTKEILPGLKFPVGEVGYAGRNDKVEKLTFLHKLVEMVKIQTIYKQ